MAEAEERRRPSKRARPASLEGEPASAGRAPAPPETLNVRVPLHALRSRMKYVDSMVAHEWRENSEDAAGAVLRMPDGAPAWLWLTFLASIAGDDDTALPSADILRLHAATLLHWCQYYDCPDAEGRLLRACQSIVEEHGDPNSHSKLYCILAQHGLLSCAAIRMRDLHLALLEAGTKDVTLAVLRACSDRPVELCRVPRVEIDGRSLKPEPVVASRLCELLRPFVPGDPASFLVETSARVGGHIVAYAAVASDEAWAARAEPMPLPLVVELDRSEDYQTWLAHTRKMVQRTRANMQEINHSRTIELNSYRATAVGACCTLNVVSCPNRPAATQWHTTYLDIGPARRTAIENCVWDGRTVKVGGSALVALLTGQEEDRKQTTEHFAFAVIHAMVKRRMSVDMGMQSPGNPSVPVPSADHPIVLARRALDAASFDPEASNATLRSLHREHERVHEELRSTINELDDQERQQVEALDRALRATYRPAAGRALDAGAAATERTPAPARTYSPT